MTTITFQHRYFVAAPISEVYAHLSEAQNYVRLTPYLVEVKDVTRYLDSGARTVVCYNAVEEFRFLGFIRYLNPIQVTMTLTEANKQMVMLVKAQYGVRLRFQFDFEIGDGTWINETVEATMPSILSSYIVKQARNAQEGRSRTLKGRLESPV